jgi:hypothetical protein
LLSLLKMERKQVKQLSIHVLALGGVSTLVSAPFTGVSEEYYLASYDYKDDSGRKDDSHHYNPSELNGQPNSGL